MKKAFVCLLVVLYFVLNYGYYIYIEDAEVERVFFKKKSITLQVRFDNIFANQGDDKVLSDLSSEERDKVINYCKYRLGIITELSTRCELERCKYGKTPLHFRRKYLGLSEVQ